jgi:hypothetical protein
MTTRLQALHQDFTDLQQLARGAFIGLGAVYMEQEHQQIQPDKASREAVKEKLPHVKTQYSRTLYPKEYTNSI